MTTAAEAALGGESAARSRAAILAGVIGNALEWYDFAVYGYFVSTISKLFFPGTDPIASLLATYAVFGVGFVMRPVGSILFGIYGDRYGRRKALSAVIFLMAFSTLAIGLLPTYGEVGVLAPILLVAARLLQGLSAGGEWGGSTAYIVEYAPEGRRERLVDDARSCHDRARCDRGKIFARYPTYVGRSSIPARPHSYSIAI